MVSDLPTARLANPSGRKSVPKNGLRSFLSRKSLSASTTWGFNGVEISAPFCNGVALSWIPARLELLKIRSDDRGVSHNVSASDDGRNKTLLKRFFLSEGVN